MTPPPSPLYRKAGEGQAWVVFKKTWRHQSRHYAVIILQNKQTANICNTTNMATQKWQPNLSITLAPPLKMAEMMRNLHSCANPLLLSSQGVCVCVVVVVCVCPKRILLNGWFWYWMVLGTTDPSSSHRCGRKPVIFNQ